MLAPAASASTDPASTAVASTATASTATASAAPASAASTAAAAAAAASAADLRDPDKSIGFYVGKNLTESGHTLLGGFGHEPSSHWIEVVPRQEHPAGSTMTVGASESAEMPGVLTDIPQVEETARYITSNYSEFEGFPAPLTNGGLNEHGVAARDIWSNSREELWDMTPTDQTGPSYSDLSRIAMERATTARDAVDILGDLINEYGFTTYGGNSHIFADENEGWVFVEFSGGEGLWAAERLGPDDIRVSYPGYIQEFPVDAVEGGDADFVSSPNLLDVATAQGWWTPGGDSINLQDVYGQDFPTASFDVGVDADPSDPSPYRNPVSLEAELESMDAMSLQDMMRLVRDPRWSDDRSGYGHVAELSDDIADPALRTLWVATTASATAPYIPVMIGTEDVPVEYSQHRYLTAGASAGYLAPEYAEQEATEYATQTFKRLMYATCARPADYLAEVTDAFEGIESVWITRHEEVIADAQKLYADGDTDGGAALLTALTHETALDGLALGGYMLDDILVRSAANGGIHMPDVDVPDGTTATVRSLSMELDGISSRDRMNCDLGGGWADGNTMDRQGTYGDPSNVPDFSASVSAVAPAESDSAMLPLWVSVSGVLGLALGAGGVWLLTRRRSA